MFVKSISKNSILLSIFAIVCTALIATTYVNTKEKIDRQQRALEEKILREILPAELYDNDLIADKKILPDHEQLNLTDNIFFYVAKKNNRVTAVILPVIAPNGYSGSIKLVVGIRDSGEIIGVRTISHQETPGLGDKIELKKSSWIKQFDNKSLINPSDEQWKVKKDGGAFDQLTGATITPRAVVQSVHNALIYFKTHQNILTDSP